MVRQKIRCLCGQRIILVKWSGFCLVWLPTGNALILVIIWYTILQKFTKRFEKITNSALSRATVYKGLPDYNRKCLMRKTFLLLICSTCWTFDENHVLQSLILSFIMNKKLLILFYLHNIYTQSGSIVWLQKLICISILVEHLRYCIYSIEYALIPRMWIWRIL